MTIEQKKTYLKQYKKSIYKIKALNKELENLRLDTLPGGIDYSKDKIQTTPTNDSMANYMIKHEEIINLISKEKEIANDRCLNVLNAINTVQDDMQQFVLHKRYILLESWESIAAETNYSIQWVYLTHAEALAEIQIPNV